MRIFSTLVLAWLAIHNGADAQTSGPGPTSQLPTATRTTSRTPTRSPTPLFTRTPTRTTTRTSTRTPTRTTTSRMLMCNITSEMPSTCYNSCPRTCENFGQRVIPCPRPTCLRQCVCRPPYVRNAQGVCVLPTSCNVDLCTGQNEVYSTCINTCDSCLNRNSTCRTIGCSAGCDCLPGHYRNLNGECVPESECECPVNEELSSCLIPYPPETCEAINIQAVCSYVNNDDCQPGCKCRRNFKRNCDGVCVDIRQCEPLKCRKNEVYNPCPSSPDCIDQRCEPVPPRRCLPFWDGLCRPKCLCQPGYCKDASGKCVVSQCGGDPNAEYNRCGTQCEPTCANPTRPTICRDPCRPSGCACKRGYVRDLKGKCIRPESCPKCAGANEEFRCGSPCDAYCSALNESCPISSKVCIPRCYCKPGFARNNNDICVPIPSCPPRPRCKTNEQFQRCPGHEYCCADEFQGINKFKAAEICVPRCRCLPGYARRDDGRCALPEKCCLDPNAEIVPCKNSCPSGTCAKPKPVACDRHCDVYPKACRCKNGYVRVSENNPKCIPNGACPRRWKHKKNSEEEEHDEHM